MDHEKNEVKEGTGVAEVAEAAAAKNHPEEAKVVQRRTKRKKAAVLLGAKSLNRVMRVVWPVVLTPRPRKGRKEAAAHALHPAKGALEMEHGSGCPVVEPPISKEGRREVTEAPATVAGLADDMISLAEGLRLCDLLEAAVSKRTVVFISSDRKLMMGEDLRQENPSCEAIVICAFCHDERECALLESAAAAGVRVDLGGLILGQGDVLELDRDVDGVLDELRRRHPDCHLRISCERCHSTTLQFNVDGASLNNATSHCNDCTVMDGEGFHEEGCRSLRRATSGLNSY